MRGPLLSDDEWRFVRGARVARLATADREGAPHVVPVVFAVVDGNIYVPVDGKQKKDIERLKRLDNIRENEKVSFLVDHYEDDWAKLGFVMLSLGARGSSTPRRTPQRMRGRRSCFVRNMRSTAAPSKSTNG